MKSAKVIGIDFDDVVVSTNMALARWHNRVYGTSYQKEDITQWDLTRLWNCTHVEMHQRINEFYDSLEHVGILPIVGAVRSLELLCYKELHVITARPEYALSVTKKLALIHVPFLLDKFNFTNLVTSGSPSKCTKADVCLELGVEVFIDDHLDYARNVASVGIPVLLFDNPWNQTDLLPQGVQRVFSWEEILEKLL